MMNRYLYYILFFSNLLISEFNHKGQLWVDYNSHNTEKSQIGYIPQFNIKYNNFSFEYSNKIIFKNLYSDYYNNDYRYWIGYNNDTVDLRIGLQKISFGSAFILRNLNWFDTIDFRNSTSQTIGKKALQLKYFSKDTFVFNFWIIPDNNKDLSYGSRVEFSNNFGNYGLVFYKDKTNYSHSLINIPQIIENKDIFSEHIEFTQNNRLGIDYRFDGYFGLWMELSYIKFTHHLNLIDYINFSTLGMDYTIDVWNGIYLMLELMPYKFKAIDDSIFEGNVSSLMIKYPIGILYDLSVIRILDNQSNDSYDFIRLISTYDYFSINYSYSINPDDYGNNFQIMIIYNY